MESNPSWPKDKETYDAAQASNKERQAHLEGRNDPLIKATLAMLQNPRNQTSLEEQTGLSVAVCGRNSCFPHFETLLKSMEHEVDVTKTGAYNYVQEATLVADGHSIPVHGIQCTGSCGGIPSSIGPRYTIKSTRGNEGAVGGEQGLITTEPETFKARLTAAIKKHFNS